MGALVGGPADRHGPARLRRAGCHQRSGRLATDLDGTPLPRSHRRRPQMHDTGSLEVRYVIDGQQRLTTLQLFLSAAAQVAHAHRCDREGRLLRKLIENDRDLVTTLDHLFKVWPTNANRATFPRRCRTTWGLRTIPRTSSRRRTPTSSERSTSGRARTARRAASETEAGFDVDGILRAPGRSSRWDRRPPQSNRFVSVRSSAVRCTSRAREGRTNSGEPQFQPRRRRPAPISGAG